MCGLGATFTLTSAWEANHHLVKVEPERTISRDEIFTFGKSSIGRTKYMSQNAVGRLHAA